MSSESHQSVLLNEVLEWLRPERAELIVDGTLGAGGHAEALLEKMPTDGKLLGLDRDAEALVIAERRLEKFGKRVMLLNENYRNLVEIITEKSKRQANAVLLDLGVSSMQLDNADRGFSFQKNAPLDMRMDRASAISAKTLLNQASEKELLDILWTYGEERFARRIVSRIMDRRSRKKIETTADLADIISSSVPASYRHGRIHPATRTFQALRIAVNEEMGSLKDFLKSMMDALVPGGRVAIISFHSLEDRLVKNAFRELGSEEKATVLTKKPLTAAEDEIVANPRARSAKMRVLEKNP